MSVTIKNWKLALLAFLFISLFTGLGFWQLQRAKQKEILLHAFTERTKMPPLHASNLKAKDLRFYAAQFTGKFDNQHVFLLDNKTFHGQVGYEVYTPFFAKGLSVLILVDRGFIPLGRSRETLPTFREISDEIIVTGMLNRSPAYVAWGPIKESASIRWPLRVEYINLNELAKLLGAPLFPYVLSLNPTHRAAFAMEWKIVTMGPERHRGYAVQWFALALTLLILFIVLNCRVSLN